MTPQQAALAQSLMGYGQSFAQQNGNPQGAAAMSGQAAAANPGLLGAIPQQAQVQAQPAMPAFDSSGGAASMTPAQQLAMAQQQALLQFGSTAAQ